MFFYSWRWLNCWFWRGCYNSFNNARNLDFRLALAWIYAQSGRDEDTSKAVNLTLSLLRGPIAVPVTDQGGEEERYVETTAQGATSVQLASRLERFANRRTRPCSFGITASPRFPFPLSHFRSPRLLCEEGLP